MLTQTVSYLRSVDWRALWHEPIVQALVGLFWLACLTPVLRTVVPATFSLLPLYYIIWMIVAIIVGVVISARWWLTWLVGTLLWSIGWLAGCLWQISQMVQR